jgi:hypothetical protein
MKSKQLLDVDTTSISGEATSIVECRFQREGNHRTPLIMLYNTSYFTCASRGSRYATVAPASEYAKLHLPIISIITCKTLISIA